MYCNAGAFFSTIVYFIIQSQRENNNRVLLHTDGKFDYTLLLTYLGGTAFSLTMFFSITTTFKYCHLAGLNIGIAETIWCFAPCITAIMEKFIYGTKLKNFQVIGIFLMICAGTFISLSHLWKDAALFADPINPVPLYVPMLISLILPFTFACMGMFLRWVYTHK